MTSPAPSTSQQAVTSKNVAGIVLPEGREKDSTSGSDSQESDLDQFNYLLGWRLHIAFAALGFGVFLINLELSITSTALVSITDDLKKFGEASWIVTAYLCTYIAGLVIWAKISDLLGRKYIILLAYLIFTIFSGGCGAAQTMEQLIIFRAFQGVGASGIYSISITMMYELVPTTKYTLYTTIVMLLVAISFVLGPIFGGLITQSGSWRWVFLLNVPSCAVAGLAMFLALPREFPYQGQHRTSEGPSLKKLDLAGGVLLIFALVLLIAGLEEAATLLDWTAARSLGPLCSSGGTWLVFFVSQWYSSRPSSRVEPLFPWRFVESRPMIGLLLNSVASGAVNIACIFQLPLHYQTAGGLSPLQAGIRLIPFSVVGTFGTAICAGLCKNRRLPPLYPGLVGGIMQIIGLIFLSRGDPKDPTWSGLLGLQALVGLGYGACLGTATLLTPAIPQKRDLAVATAAVVQCRFLGSAIAISILTAVGNTLVRNDLQSLLSPGQIAGLFQSVQRTIATLPESLQVLVREEFTYSFNLQMRILIGFAVGSLLATLVMWQRPQIRVP